MQKKKSQPCQAGGGALEGRRRRRRRAEQLEASGWAALTVSPLQRAHKGVGRKGDGEAHVITPDTELLTSARPAGSCFPHLSRSGFSRVRVQGSRRTDTTGNAAPKQLQTAVRAGKQREESRQNRCLITDVFPVHLKCQKSS